MNAWIICLGMILVAAPFVSSNKTRPLDEETSSLNLGKGRNKEFNAQESSSIRQIWRPFRQRQCSKSESDTSRGASQSPSSHLQENNMLQRQRDILSLFEGFCCNNTNDVARSDFPYREGRHYKDPHIGVKFLESYEDGFIDKESYFTLYTYKNRHDTYRLFDVLYFAKDYNTFLKIAKWAKKELNPLQFVYALTAAIYRRRDTRKFKIPTFYEVFPQYYTPAHVMDQIEKARTCGITKKTFTVNDTGSEYSFYKDQTFDYYRYGFKYNEYDAESRMAYFREDVGLRNWYTKMGLFTVLWVSGDKYPDIKWKRRAENIQMITSNMLKRYNAERASNGLPPTEPLNFRKSIKSGYNSHLTDFRGRSFYPRPDNFNIFDSNPRGVNYLELMYWRFLTQVEAQTMFNPSNSTYICIKGITGYETFLNIFYGITTPEIRSYYRPLYHLAMDTIDTALSAANDVIYTGSTFGDYLTAPVDHTFYQLLAWMEPIQNAYDARKTPYTKKDIELPGVTITNVEITNLETYFEKYNYSISNVCPGKNGTNYNYTISRCRLNHKPFTYRVEIDSTKQIDVSVKMILAPKCDAASRPLGWTAFFKNAVAYDLLHVTVNPGCNTAKRSSKSDPNRKEPATINDIKEALNRGEILPYVDYEAYPSNLALPRGSKSGKVFQVMFIAQPRVDNIYDTDYSDPEIIQKYDEKDSLRYPFDRPISRSVLNVSNVFFTEVPIYDYSEHCTNECITA